jgi:CheY-like chemotaxis protein
MVALVIEDMPVMRDLATAHLRRLGYEKIVVAQDGAHALNLLERLKPTFILSDIDMPYVNGLQVLKNVRMGRTWADRGTPFLLLTGHSDADVVGIALQLDASAFLRKPIDGAMLHDRLKRIATTPLSPRTVSEYGVISIDTLGPLAGRRRSDNERRPLVYAQAKVVQHAELTGEFVIARTIFNRDGETVLRPGTEVTPWLIEQLRDLIELNLIENEFAVIREGTA